MQSFVDRFRIVSRIQREKLQLSSAKHLEVEQDVFSHLGRMKKDFESGDYDEKDISNAEETHSIINMENGKLLDSLGRKKCDKLTFHPELKG